jgi:hypothetical protein
MNAPTNSDQDANSPQDEYLDSTAESEFENLSDSADPGIVREFLEFLRDNKKWWLAPILIVTLLLVGLVFLTASPAAPFIYTLF